MNTNQEMTRFFENQLKQAKTHFERALDCKHTEFDDLYPYMNEQPQFFWYKRYVAWQELLTVVRLASDLGIDWQPVFSQTQTEFIKKKVLEAKVLDQWYENEKQEKVEEEVRADD